MKKTEWFQEVRYIVLLILKIYRFTYSHSYVLLHFSHGMLFNPLLQTGLIKLLQSQCHKWNEGLQICMLICWWSILSNCDKKLHENESRGYDTTATFAKYSSRIVEMVISIVVVHSGNTFFSNSLDITCYKLLLLAAFFEYFAGINPVLHFIRDPNKADQGKICRWCLFNLKMFIFSFIYFYILFVGILLYIF